MNITEDPEEAGFCHMVIDYNSFKLNDLVEVITNFGICVVGVIVCNKYEIIRLADPCKVMIQPFNKPESNTIQYMTAMLPWRTIGDDNYAQFKKNDISNISKVNSIEFIKLWRSNVDEFARLWYKSGNRIQE